jgi:hypothetical protein
MIEITIRVNPETAVKVVAQNVKEALRQAQVFCSLPAKCPLCNSAVRLFHRSAQGYDYYGLQCDGFPQHESNFGQHKEGGTLFYKTGPDSWKDRVFSKNEDSGSSAPPINDDDIPF